MAYLKNKAENQSKVSFPRSCKADNLCSFKEIVAAVLDIWADDDPEHRSCYKDMVTLLQEPCLGIDCEGQNQMVADILGLSGINDRTE